MSSANGISYSLANTPSPSLCPLSRKPPIPPSSLVSENPRISNTNAKTSPLHRLSGASTSTSTAPPLASAACTCIKAPTTVTRLGSPSQPPTPPSALNHLTTATSPSPPC